MIKKQCWSKKECEDIKASAMYKKYVLITRIAENVRSSNKKISKNLRYPFENEEFRIRENHKNSQNVHNHYFSAVDNVLG